MSQIAIDNNIPVPAGRRSNFRHGHSSLKGGRPISKEYSAWQQMLNRVYKGHGKMPPQAEDGIVVHEPWKSSFPAFLEYIGTAPSAKHRLQRPDQEKGYVPGNVVWAIPGELSIIRRGGHAYLYEGKEYSLRMLATLAGISPQAMNNRLKKGWSVEKAVTTPLHEVPKGPRPKGVRAPHIGIQTVRVVGQVAGKI